MIANPGEWAAVPMTDGFQIYFDPDSASDLASVQYPTGLHELTINKSNVVVEGVEVNGVADDGEDATQGINIGGSQSGTAPYPVHM